MNERNPAISKGIDWTLAWIYLLLVSVGIMAIFAVTYKEGDPIIASFLGFKTDYSKQFFFFCASAITSERISTEITKVSGRHCGKCLRGQAVQVRA